MNKRPTILFAALLHAGLLFSSCNKDDAEESDETEVTLPGSNVEEDDDYTLNSSGATVITLNQTAISISGTGATASGTTATITEAGTYRVTGTLSSGQLLVDAAASDKVKIMLDGASITGSGDAPFRVKSASKTILYLMPGTNSSLTDASGNASEAVLYSASNLSVFGTGTLSLNAKEDAGIDAEGGIILKEGTFLITSEGSAIKSSDNVTVDGGTYTLTAGNDGLHADAALNINGGNINITKSEEGLEGEVITITGGTVRLVSTDDGLNGSSDTDATCYLYMKGGYLYINAGGDGVDVNGSIEMSDGTIIVDGPTSNADGPIDYDNTFKMTGGYLLAVGSSGMAQQPGAASTQPSVLVTFGSSLQAGTLVNISSGTGANVLTYAPAKTYQSVMLSSPLLVTGTSYSVYTGGTATGTLLDGLYSNAAYSGGTLRTGFTISSVLTKIGAN
ncbi:MAG: carbohydrate-binding domain-containing protein [Chitinophagaceae bacterium]